jgi:tetratricopeptide (TPR) repeat protein
MNSISQLVQWFVALHLADQIALAILVLTLLLVVLTTLLWIFPREPITKGREKDRLPYLTSPKALSEVNFVAGFNQSKIHLEIPEDQKILELIRNHQDILIVGRPGIGKSHAAIRAIKRFQTWRDFLNGWTVVIPDKEAMHHLGDFRLKKRRYLIFLDDVNEYIDEIEGGERLFDLIARIRRQAKEAIVIATIRSTRPELDALIRDAKANSHFKQVRLPDWPLTRGQLLSRSSGLPMDAWDGTPLSVKQPSPRMELLYKQATEEEKSLFRELSYLWSLRIKFATRKTTFDLYSTGLFGSNTNFDAAISLLYDKGFLRSATNPIIPYEAYLSVISDWHPQDGTYDSVVGILASEAMISDLLAIAGKHFLDGDLDAAVKIYEVCTSIDPTMEHAFYRLGIVRARQRRWEDAKNAFQTAAGLNLQWSTAWFRLANAFNKLGLDSEGKRAFLRGRAVIFGESDKGDASSERWKRLLAGRAFRDENNFA